MPRPVHTLPTDDDPNSGPARCRIIHIRQEVTIIEAHQVSREEVTRSDDDDESSSSIYYSSTLKISPENYADTHTPTDSQTHRLTD